MSVMGNKSCNMAVKWDNYLGFQGQMSYEKDYHPMSLEMKKTLVTGRKIQRYVPGKVGEELTKEHEEATVMEKLRAEDQQDYHQISTKMEEIIGEYLPKEETEKALLNVKIEPIVTVVNMASLVRPSPELQHGKDFAEAVKSNQALTSPLVKSPQLTNRKYSIIDIKTGVRKSTFSMELEEKLKQSKLELGFDDDLDSWKEFKFKIEKPEAQLEKNTTVNSSEDSSAEKRNDRLKILPHNCQILGLCSLGKNENFDNRRQNLCPSGFKDETTKEFKFAGLDKGDTGHAKKSTCDCDVCTLAFLTGMGFPVEREIPVEKKKLLDDQKKERREKVKIFDFKDVKRSIEVSVIKKGQDTIRTSPSGGSGSIEGDCTNLRIKKMFRKNTRTCRHESDTSNEYATYNKTSNVFDCSRDVRLNSPFNASPLMVWRKSPDRSRGKSKSLGSKRSKIFRHSSARKTSSSTISASKSSSLSTVLSYRRVRQIFQTFIEKNCSRKVKKNINKFREMEELGLGEVKNNRWYPSAFKTLSIWNDIHSNVQGCQVEFKKFPKAPSMSLK